MNSLGDRIKRREACFGEAWSQLQKIGFPRKGKLPCFTDIPLSPSLIPDAPYSPVTSPACYFSGPSHQTAFATHVSLPSDSEAPLASSPPVHMDDNICFQVPNGMRRGLVRAKRVARRRPALCAADRAQSKRRLFGPATSPGDDPTAEFRRYIEAGSFEITKLRQSHHQPGGPPCDGMQNGLATATEASQVKSSLEWGVGRETQGNQQPPLVSMESTLMKPRCMAGDPVLFHGSSSVRPRTAHVTCESQPDCVHTVLTQSVNTTRSPILRSGTVHSNRAISLHEDIFRAFEALGGGASPDYLGPSRCPTQAS